MGYLETPLKGLSPPAIFWIRVLSSRFTFWDERNLPGLAGVICPYLRSTMKLVKGSSSREDGRLVSKRKDVVVRQAKLASLAEAKVTKC